MARLIPELDNIRAALSLFQAGSTPEGMRLQVALGWYWVITGSLGEARTWLDAAPLTDERFDADLRASTARMLGLVQITEGDMDGLGATATLLSELAIATADVDHWQGWADSYGAMQLFGDPQKAMAVVSVGLDRLRITGEPWEVAFVTTIMGELERSVENITAAEEHYRAALAIFETDGDRYATSAGYLNLGECAVQKGDFDAGGRYLRKALAGAREMHSEWMTAYCTVILGCAASGSGQVRNGAILIAAATHWLTRHGWQLQPIEQQIADRAMSDIASAIDATTHAELTELGVQMGLDGALEHVGVRADPAEA